MLTIDCRVAFRVSFRVDRSMTFPWESSDLNYNCSWLNDGVARKTLPTDLVPALSLRRVSFRLSFSSLAGSLLSSSAAPKFSPHWFLACYAILRYDRFPLAPFRALSLLPLVQPDRRFVDVFLLPFPSFFPPPLPFSVFFLCECLLLLMWEVAEPIGDPHCVHFFSRSQRST